MLTLKTSRDVGSSDHQQVTEQTSFQGIRSIHSQPEARMAMEKERSSTSSLGNEKGVYFHIDIGDDLCHRLIVHIEHLMGSIPIT